MSSFLARIFSFVSSIFSFRDSIAFFAFCMVLRLSWVVLSAKFDAAVFLSIWPFISSTCFLISICSASPLIFTSSDISIILFSL
jgi:hypothetical protein